MYPPVSGETRQQQQAADHKSDSSSKGSKSSIKRFINYLGRRSSSSSNLLRRSKQFFESDRNIPVVSPIEISAPTNFQKVTGFRSFSKPGSEDQRLDDDGILERSLGSRRGTATDKIGTARTHVSFAPNPTQTRARGASVDSYAGGGNAPPSAMLGRMSLSKKEKRMTPLTRIDVEQGQIWAGIGGLEKRKTAKDYVYPSISKY